MTPEDIRPAVHRGLLILLAVLTAVALVLTAGSQIYDTNFYFLSEATTLLAGDHPYRDFFEWGAPLAAYLSAGVQLLVGYRLIGEFLVQWSFILAGVVIAFHLGLRLSRSVAAVVAMWVLSAIVLSYTPTYHYSKLFFFPLATWLAWRYMDRPTPARAAVFGLCTAVAFLFRHDYGLYIGCASMMAFGLARVTVPASRAPRSMLRDGVAYVAAAFVITAPWAAVVQMNEGLVEYTRLRAAMFEEPADRAPHAALLELNPLRQLRPDPPPAPRAAVVGFFWKPETDAARQQQLQQTLGLRPLAEPDSRGRPQYAVADVYDLGLFELDPYITDGAGFEWDRLKEIRAGLPSHDNTALWLEQMALLVPLLLIASAGLEFWRNRDRGDAASQADACRILLAAVFLVIVDAALFRQPSYMATVAPVTAALSARFLVSRAVLVRAAAVVVLIVTIFAALVWTRDSPIYTPSEYANSVSSAFEQLMASPPIDGVSSPPLRYVHDCTTDGDHILVTGSTPYQVNYYAERPFAGHLFWNEGWRSDPQHQQQLLDILERQSVPFAFSTHDPVFDEFKRYQAIWTYLRMNYVEVEGFHGRLLVDARRTPTGTFGTAALPCFR